MNFFAEKIDEYISKSKPVLEGLSSIVFPQSLYCICCGNIVDDTRSYSVCDHCMERIRWNVDAPKLVDDMAVMKCVEYGIYERSIIFALKYDGHRYIAREIGKMMADRLRASELSGAHIIIPVPLHEDKQIERGFNQTELIGKYLSEETGWDMVNALVRRRATRAMRGLGPEERSKNVRGAMKLRKETIDLIRNKDIMLIDDFYTTGSTARECKRALSLAEPKSISFLAFAGREWKEVAFK